MNAKLKTALTHLGAITAAVVATLAWTSTKAVDLYAVWNQLNVVVAEITKLIATVTPLLTTAYAIYRTTAKQRLEELAKDPTALQAAKQIQPTPEVQALADALKKNGS